MTPRLHYVYAHKRASDGCVFYIGKGKSRRAWSASGRNRQWRFVAEKHGFEVEIVKDGLPESCALTLEQIAIARVGLANLANATLGGGGIAGWKHSNETKRRIGDASKARKIGPKQLAALKTTQQFTPETRRKMSEAAKRRIRAPLSAETRAKIRASHMGLRPTDEVRRKLSLAHIGKHRGRDNATYDHTIRHFVHADHGEFVGTRGDLIAQFNLSSSCMAALIKGNQKSVKGWRLK